MRAKVFAIGVVAGVLLASAVVVLAGSLDPPSGPLGAASQMHTLEQIYNRLHDGAATTKMTTFAEPSSGPGAGTMHTLDDIMAIAPAADNISGTLPVEVLAGKTYWGLRTDGTWGTQTGTRSPAPVRKTGQAFSGRDRDDGELQIGVAWPSPRFTDNGDGTVTDNLTGLIWLAQANCFDQRNWSEALSDANGLTAGYCGLTDGSKAGDWRLPNVQELQSLIDYGQQEPALPNGYGDYFTGVQADYYWSSTALGSDANNIWNVDLKNGNVNHTAWTLSLYVWPVRDGQ